MFHITCFYDYVLKSVVRTQSYTAEVSRNLIMHFKVMENTALCFNNCLTLKSMELAYSKFAWAIVLLHV